jgi:hypothetical protein
MEQLLSRLEEIDREEQGLIERLGALSNERQALHRSLRPREAPKPAPTPPAPPASEPVAIRRGRSHKPPVPLPAGRTIPRRQLDALKAQVNTMDRGAFLTQGRNFIQEWYARLAGTPAWHELNSHMQTHFGARRQQIAGVAARIARANGEALVQSNPSQ